MLSKEIIKSILRDYKEPYFGLLLTIFFLPYEMILSTIALVFFILLVIIKNKRKNVWPLIKENKIALIPALYFLLIIFGLIYTNSLDDGISRLSTQLSILIFPLLIIITNLDFEKIKILKKVFLYSCIIFCCISLLTLLYNLITKYEYKHHYNFIQSSLYHFHFPYDSLYINFSYAILLFNENKRNFKRVVAALFFIVIFLFGVRIGIFSFILISLLYAVINFKRLFKLTNLLFIIVLLITSFFLVKTSKYVSDKYFDTLEKIGIDLYGNVSEIGEEYHKISRRQILWSNSFELIKKKPVLGYGTNGGQKDLDKLYIEDGCIKCINMNSHNQFLTTTLNYGFVGFFLLIFIIGFSAQKAIITKNIEHLIFVLLIIISFSTESMLVRQKGIMFFSIFSSLFLIEYQILKSTKQL